MAVLGSILLADDEETFCESTSRLLKREGFECHCVKGADEALESLQRRQFDLLVADIRMPKNTDFRLVREVQRLDRQMPVIIVTGYPSAETAMRSVDMSVVAYLTKPLDIDELVSRARTAIEHSQKRRKLATVHRRLDGCLPDLDAAQSQRLPREDGADELVSIATIRTVAACLSELLELGDAARADWPSHNLCELLDCPQQPAHRRAIVKTIGVLKETKGAFKSKALAELRTELEGLINGSAGVCRRDQKRDTLP